MNLAQTFLARVSVAVTLLAFTPSWSASAAFEASLDPGQPLVHHPPLPEPDELGVSAPASADVVIDVEIESRPGARSRSR